MIGKINNRLTDLYVLNLYFLNMIRIFFIKNLHKAPIQVLYYNYNSKNVKRCIAVIDFREKSHVYYKLIYLFRLW